ncbi:hypothetical protein [Sphingobacterium sp. UBA6320]|uniref:hypothetical protein n=1 Tax=Sphingobacterium sp. UBA6320 TaxID=1947510 RepID=UPI0025F3F508|nr:hypothetical protein [Sphingobacterium sp. UBA6320]
MEKQHSKPVKELMVKYQQEDIQNYDHINLSKSEIESITNEALRQARKSKHFQIERKKYWDKVNTPVTYPVLNLEQTKEFFMKRVLELNPDFKITEFNIQIIDLLAAYFSKDESFEDEGFSFKKGIMLVGPVGCGKTTILKAFAVNSTNPFSFTTARKISDSYLSKENGGEHTIDKFSNMITSNPSYNFGFKSIGLCIDDLGVESVKKNFGNEIDVVGDIILNRYEQELFTTTHFTANIGGNEIEQAYGLRVKSRLRQMCNFIAFDENTPDYRN